MHWYFPPSLSHTDKSDWGNESCAVPSYHVFDDLFTALQTNQKALEQRKWRLERLTRSNGYATLYYSCVGKMPRYVELGALNSAKAITEDTITYAVAMSTRKTKANTSISILVGQPCCLEFALVASQGKVAYHVKYKPIESQVLALLGCAIEIGIHVEFVDEALALITPTLPHSHHIHSSQIKSRFLSRGFLPLLPHPSSKIIFCFIYLFIWSTIIFCCGIKFQKISKEI